MIVAIGYRRPVRVLPGSVLTAEIWIETPVSAEPVFSKEFPVEPQKGWRTPVPPSFRIDLARYGGQEVTLVFRTVFRGRVRMSPLDIIGFAMTWQDPRIASKTR